MTTKRGEKDWAGHEFVMTREFSAPRELVFAAWTDPKHLAQWWGPRGFTNPVCEWDARPGGKIYDVMRAPGGPEAPEHPMGGEFREVTPPGKVVFTCGPLDENGKMLFEFLHDVTLTEKDGKTKMVLRSKVLWTTPEAGKYISGFEMGMGLSLERLEELLARPGGPLIVERTLNAPVEVVWRCLTTKEDMHRWFFELEEFRPEAGFKFNFAVEHEGMTYSHLCKVTEVAPQKKLAFTWRYDGHEGDSLVTLELFEEGTKTKLKLTHEGLETFPQTPQFARKNFEGGWNFITTALKEYVESDSLGRDIMISRDIAAPRELVWQAMTNPQHVVHWWGPRGFTTAIEKMDFHVGGEWKHVMRGPDGREYPNQSVFTLIEKPAKIVYEHGGSEKGKRRVDFVSTWTFEELARDKTRVTIHMVFPTVEARDIVVKEYKAIEGGKQTLERLGEFLKEKSGK